MTMTELWKSETRDKVIDWKILPPCNKFVQCFTYDPDSLKPLSPDEIHLGFSWPFQAILNVFIGGDFDKDWIGSTL